MSREHIGISKTLVSTEAAVPLGTKFIEMSGNDGEKHWVYVYNDEASAAFAVGDVIRRDPSAPTTYAVWGGLRSAAAGAEVAVECIGVAQHAIAAGSFGFIQCRGKGTMRAGSATITADTALTTGGTAEGEVIDFAAGEEERIIGMSLAAAVADATFDAYITIE